MLNIRERAGGRKHKPVRRPESRSTAFRFLFGHWGHWGPGTNALVRYRAVDGARSAPSGCDGRMGLPRRPLVLHFADDHHAFHEDAKPGDMTGQLGTRSLASAVITARHHTENQKY